MLRKVIAPALLATCRDSFDRFTHALKDEDEDGSWHSPWSIRTGGHLPAASLISAVLQSWAWPVVEKICGSTDITVLLGFSTARHVVDKALGVGAHQDATAVTPELPFALWIPLQEVTPRQTAGLGFITPAPTKILPTLHHNDVGSDYVLENFSRAWVPHYAAGDLTVHTSLSPHFTTGYGTETDRYSLEIRALARDRAPLQFQDPALHVGRRDGKVTVVGTSCSPGVDAGAFLADLSGSGLTRTGAQEIRPSTV